VHGAVKILRVMQLNIDPDGIGKTAGKQLCLLQRIQPARMSEPRLERGHVGVDVGGEWQPGEVGQVIGGQRRSEALMAE